MKRIDLVAALAVLLSACPAVPRIPDSAIELNTRGAQALERGQLDEAKNLFELALEPVAGLYPEAHANLCIYWLKTGNLPKAKQECIVALHQTNGDLAIPHNTLGTIYRLEGAHGKALTEFEAAVHRVPTYLEARYNVCISLAQLERLKEARTCYEKIVLLNYRIADAEHGLCLLDIHDKNFPGAIGHCTRTVELDAQDASGFLHLAIAYQSAGKACEALAAAKQCLELDPQSLECKTTREAVEPACSE
jgi:tetratricopeptide (TPR) repeat protein